MLGAPAPSGRPFPRAIVGRPSLFPGAHSRGGYLAAFWSPLHKMGGVGKALVA